MPAIYTKAKWADTQNQAWILRDRFLTSNLYYTTFRLSSNKKIISFCVYAWEYYKYKKAADCIQTELRRQTAILS